MRLPVWLNVVVGGYALALAAQTAPEQPVGLVLKTQSAKLQRANTAFELTAKVGDMLFTGDTLRGDGSASEFLYCPEQSANTLSPDGAVRLEQTRFRMKSGRVTAKSAVAACFLPMAVRVAVASQQHYGMSMVRPLETDQPASSFPERLSTLALAQRTAFNAELAPIDLALAADGRNVIARIARATIFEKYNLRIDAAAEYRKVLQEWPDATWILGKLFALEDRPGPQKLATPPAAEGQTYALLVGVSNYRSDRISPLVYAARDASLFEDFLKSPRGGDLPDANIELLLDDQGTTAAVRLGITSFLKAKASKNDTVLLIIASHGTVDSKTGQAYIVTHDADPEDLAGTALSMADLEDLFRKELSGVRRALLYLDTCHAGQLGTVPISPINDAVTPLTRVRGEVFSFMASGKDELSEEGPQYGGGHGAFSYFVVDALNGSADTNGDGSVSFNEFVDYVREMVRKSTRQPQHAREMGDLGRTRMSEIAKPGLALAPWPTGETTEIAGTQRTRGLNRQTTADPPLPAPEEADRAVTELEARRSTLTPAAYLDEENKLRVALENKGRETLLRYLRGEQAPQNRSHFTSGASYFAAAQRLSPESVLLESERVFCLGRAALFEPRDFNRAADLLERAVRLDPLSAYSYNALGIAHLQRAAFREAEGAFRDAIRRAPRWIYPRHNLALTLAESGAYAAAEREYREAVRLEPRYSYLHYSLGALLQKVGRGKEAESAYLAAIRFDPNHAEAYTGLGVVRAARGRSQQAEEDYQTAIRLNPKLPAAGHDLALLYQKDKKTDLAIRTWVENLERNPNFTPSRMSLAMAYRNAGSLEDAVNQYETVLTVAPNYAAARMALHETLGDRRKAENRPDEARAEYQQALAIAAGDDDRKRIGRKLRIQK